MQEKPNRLWITALALGWLFDFLFWGQSFGINFALFTSLCLAAGGTLLWLAHARPARRTGWLLPLFLFFAACSFMRAEPMTVFLAGLFTLLLLGVLALTYRGGRWLEYGLADYFGGFLKLTGSLLVRPLMFLGELKQAPPEAAVRFRIDGWAIVRGLALALPVLVVFGALLASADTIFGDRLNAVLRLLFNPDNLPQYLFRLLYILLIAYALAGSFLHAASQSNDAKLAGQDGPLIARFLGFTESAIVLGGVTLLFGAFVIVQFKYFFGGQANLGPGGLTNSEYARRGFGELAAVALLSLLLILGLSSLTRRDRPAQQRAFSGLSVAVVVLVMVILVSAYQRLSLTELAHGFSRLRAYSHVFYIWLGLLLAAVVVLEILHRERAFAAAALLAALGFAVSLSLLNVDGFIVTQNIRRAARGAYLNVPDLAALSTDSVPALVEEFQSPGLPPALHEALGAILLCRADYNAAGRNPDWRSFDFSAWRADQALKSVQVDLQAYTLKNSGTWGSGRARTPSNVLYDCY